MGECWMIESKRIWNCNEVTVISVVIDALGTIS